MGGATYATRKSPFAANGTGGRFSANEILASLLISYSNHVMEDLRPYMCPVKDCARGDQMYARRRFLFEHLRTAHPLESCRECLFCGTNTEVHYVKHVGHHMEEIAFGILTTAYEDWSYADTNSSVGSLLLAPIASPPKKRERARPFVCKDFPPCQQRFIRSEHLARHVR